MLAGTRPARLFLASLTTDFRYELEAEWSCEKREEKSGRFVPGIARGSKKCLVSRV
jgi:hypothetical protein